MSANKIKALCRVAILAALYFLLNMLSIRAGNLRVTFASLPVIVAALLFGPGEAFTAAALGELLNQMLSYGFTLTTALWLLPPAIRGLLVGLAAARSSAAGRPLEEHPGACYTVCLLAAAATTACNTAAIAADSLLYHYFTWALIFGDLAFRLITGLVTAAAITTVSIPLVRLLRRRLAVRRD